MVFREVLPLVADGALDVDSDELQRFNVAACRALGRVIPALDETARHLCQSRLRELLRIVDPGWIPGLMKYVSPALNSDEAQTLAKRALAQPNVFTPLAASRVFPAPMRWSLCLSSLEGIPLGKSNDPVYADVLASTVDALLEAPDDVRLHAWRQACARLRGERAAVASHLAVLAPLAASVQRQATLSAAAGSLLVVQSWWP